MLNYYNVNAAPFELKKDVLQKVGSEEPRKNRALNPTLGTHSPVPLFENEFFVLNFAVCTRLGAPDII